MDFVTGYYAALQADPRPYTWRERKILDALSVGGAKAKAIATVMESNAKTKIGIDQNTVVDWTPGATVTKADGTQGTIDWTSLLAFITALLPLIEALITALGG